LEGSKGKKLRDKKRRIITDPVRKEAFGFAESGLEKADPAERTTGELGKR